MICSRQLVSRWILILLALDRFCYDGKRVDSVDWAGHRCNWLQKMVLFQQILDGTVIFNLKRRISKGGFDEVVGSNTGNGSNPSFSLRHARFHPQGNGTTCVPIMDHYACVNIRI